MTIEFTPYPKTPRLYREVFITEKIDGTNAAILIADEDKMNHAIIKGVKYPLWWEGDKAGWHKTAPAMETTHGPLVVAAQSRKRLITPNQDNFGFARWVYDHRQELAEILGPGTHFGEWWGSGIQRGYGQKVKRFSLFNVGRWDEHEGKTPLPPEAEEIGLGTVPILYTGRFSTAAIQGATDLLRDTGSQAAPGFKPAEGIIVYHVDAGQAFKVLLENDDISKTEAGVK